MDDDHALAIATAKSKGYEKAARSEEEERERGVVLRGEETEKEEGEEAGNSVNRGLNTVLNASFRIPKGSLVGVLGSVGSGKSSLLSGILGAAHHIIAVWL